MRCIKWRCFWWPSVTPNPQTTPIFAFFVTIHIFVVSKHETSCLVYRLTVPSPSRRTTNRPWKERGYVTWPILNFGDPIHISGMAEASCQILCKGRLYQVLPKGWQITPKRGVVLLTWPIFVCTTVDLENILHSTLLNLTFVLQSPSRCYDTQLIETKKSHTNWYHFHSLHQCPIKNLNASINSGDYPSTFDLNAVCFCPVTLDLSQLN